MPEGELSQFEWVEERKGFREWLIPAALINTKGKVSNCGGARLKRAVLLAGYAFGRRVGLGLAGWQVAQDKAIATRHTFLKLLSWYAISQIGNPPSRRRDEISPHFPAFVHLMKSSVMEIRTGKSFCRPCATFFNKTAHTINHMSDKFCNRLAINLRLACRHFAKLACTAL